MSDREPSSEPSRATLVREVTIASLGILVILGALKHAIPHVPFVGEYAGTIAAAIQLYLPIYLIGRRGISLESLGLSTARWREDLRLFLLLAALTTVPYALGHHVWQTWLLHRTFHPRLPDGIASSLVSFLVVALAEETYFRGYLQERMTRLWPPARRLFGTPFGLAIVASSVVFAFAHFVGEYRFDRLGPFFPALVFGLCRARTGTIVSAIGYHAFCNVLADVLFASYRGS